MSRKGQSKVIDLGSTSDPLEMSRGSVGGPLRLFETKGLWEILLSSTRSTAISGEYLYSFLKRLAERMNSLSCFMLNMSFSCWYNGAKKQLAF